MFLKIERHMKVEIIFIVLESIQIDGTYTLYLNNLTNSPSVVNIQ